MQEDQKTPKNEERMPACPLSSPANAMSPYTEQEDEINLLDLLIVLLKHKKMIISVVFFAGVLAVGGSLLMTNMYRSECTIAPTGQDQGPGGLAALGGFGAMIASETGLIAAGSLDQFDVVLKSRELTNIIVKKYNLLPILFKSNWDAANKKWKKEPPKFEDIYRAVHSFLNISADKKQNVVKVSFTDKDPRLAQAVVNYYITGLSDYLRSQTLDDATAQQTQLYKQLAKTDDPLLKNKLYDLVAKQIEKEALARVQKYYSFNVIDPAFVPERKSSPKRALICVLTVMVAFFIAVFLAFFLEYAHNLKTRENPERLADLRRYMRFRKKNENPPHSPFYKGGDKKWKCEENE